MRKIPRWVIGGIISLFAMIALILIFYFLRVDSENSLLYKIFVLISAPPLFTTRISHLFAGDGYRSIGPIILLIFPIYYFLIGAVAVKLFDIFREE